MWLDQEIPYLRALGPFPITKKGSTKMVSDDLVAIVCRLVNPPSYRHG